MKSWHVLLIVNHPMITTHGLLSKYEFGYLWLQKPNDKNFFKNVLSKIMIRLKDCTSQEFFSTLKS